MSSPQVAAIAAVGVATAVFLLRRLLQVKPFIPSLKMSVHLHRIFFGAGELFNSVEGLGRITFDEADDNGMCQFYVLGARCISVLKAEHIRTVVLASNFRQRVPLFDEYVDAIVGTKSLVQVMGHEWKLHRKLISRAFGWQNLASMAPAMGSIAHEFASHLLATQASSKFDVFPMLKLATLDIIGTNCNPVSHSNPQTMPCISAILFLGATAFGASFGAIQHTTNHPVVEAFTFLLDDMNRRAIDEPLHPSSMFYWLPTAANRMHRQQTAILRRTIDDLVASRLHNPPANDDSQGKKTHHDLLQYMVDAAAAAAHNEDASGGVTPQSFADNLLTFLFAGYDTTSIALAYTLHLLAAHPQVQDKVVAEIEAVLGADTAPTCDTVSRLTFCAAVVTESVRLFPPVLVTMRSLEADLHVGGHHVPKGTNVMLPIYWIHRYEENWGADATAFRPERHLDEIHGKDKAFRMMAFSAGPRNCVGMRFAMMEAVIVLAVVLRRCRFSLPTDAPPVRPVVAGLVQKPEHGIWLHVQPRESAPAL
ncbi:hypothetical protein B5M09_010851 [Aphanomyces astaci]|nr:hypothetical protein B5M09_010851 [Aphanomyces astaci]